MLRVSNGPPPRFGQLAVGPPGSGKSTYCRTMQQYLSSHKRPTIICNLDSGSEHSSASCAVDVRDLICVEDVMQEFSLGPNGAAVYCMEHLEANLDWLGAQLAKHEGSYVLFDMPGQVELVTHHGSIKKVLQYLSEQLGFRLCAVHLVDSFHVTDIGRYISVLMVTLNTMLMLELPQLNVLSKIDLIEEHGAIPYGLEVYTNPQHLPRLLELEEHRMPESLRPLARSLAELVDEFDLVTFSTLDSMDEQSVAALAAQADKSGGYVFSREEDLRGLAVQRPFEYEALQQFQDKYYK